jgi:hypothetical protein
VFTDVILVLLFLDGRTVLVRVGRQPHSGDRLLADKRPDAISTPSGRFRQFFLISTPWLPAPDETASLSGRFCRWDAADFAG